MESSIKVKFSGYQVKDIESVITPLKIGRTTFGRKNVNRDDGYVHVPLISVSRQHMHIDIDENNKAFLSTYSTGVLLNGKRIRDKTVVLTDPSEIVFINDDDDDDGKKDDEIFIFEKISTYEISDDEETAVHKEDPKGTSNTILQEMVTSSNNELAKPTTGGKSNSFEDMDPETKTFVLNLMQNPDLLETARAYADNPAVAFNIAKKRRQRGRPPGSKSKKKIGRLL